MGYSRYNTGDLSSIFSLPTSNFLDSLQQLPVPQGSATINGGYSVDYGPSVPGLVPQEPIAQMQQQSPDSFIPQSYLNALAGLPSIQFDSMGRMGITDDQRRAAQNRGMGDMLMGVAQGFLNTDPMAPMKGGAIAGQNMQGMLDNFSKQNMANINATLDNKIKQLTAFGLMSDIEKGQVAIDSAKLKLDQDKRANEALQQVALHYAPLADFAADLAAAEVKDPKSQKAIRDSIDGAKAMMFAELQRGNTDKAMQIFNSGIGQWLSLDENLSKAKMTQLANEGLMQVEVTSKMIPTLQKLAESLGATLEIGADSKPKFVHPYEQQLRELEIKKAQAYIKAQQADATYKLGGGSIGARLQESDVKEAETVRKGLDSAVALVSQYGHSIQQVKERIKDLPPKERPAAEKALDNLIKAFGAIGVTNLGGTTMGKYITGNDPLFKWINTSDEEKKAIAQQYVGWSRNRGQ